MHQSVLLLDSDCPPSRLRQNLTIEWDYRGMHQDWFLQNYLRIHLDLYQTIELNLQGMHQIHFLLSTTHLD